VSRNRTHTRQFVGDTPSIDVQMGQGHLEAELFNQLKFWVAVVGILCDRNTTSIPQQRKAWERARPKYVSSQSIKCDSVMSRQYEIEPNRKGSRSFLRSLLSTRRSTMWRGAEETAFVLM
jgi:hypothetical protein